MDSPQFALRNEEMKSHSPVKEDYDNNSNAPKKTSFFLQAHLEEDAPALGEEEIRGGIEDENEITQCMSTRKNVMKTRGEGDMDRYEHQEVIGIQGAVKGAGTTTTSAALELPCPSVHHEQEQDQHHQEEKKTQHSYEWVKQTPTGAALQSRAMHETRRKPLTAFTTTARGTNATEESNVGSSKATGPSSSFSRSTSELPSFTSHVVERVKNQPTPEAISLYVPSPPPLPPPSVHELMSTPLIHAESGNRERRNEERRKRVGSIRKVEKEESHPLYVEERGTTHAFSPVENDNTDVDSAQQAETPNAYHVTDNASLETPKETVNERGIAGCHCRKPSLDDSDSRTTCRQLSLSSTVNGVILHGDGGLRDCRLHETTDTPNTKTSFLLSTPQPFCNPTVNSDFHVFAAPALCCWSSKPTSSNNIRSSISSGVVDLSLLSSATKRGTASLTHTDKTLGGVSSQSSTTSTSSSPFSPGNSSGLENCTSHHNDQGHDPQDSTVLSGIAASPALMQNSLMPIGVLPRPERNVDEHIRSGSNESSHDETASTSVAFCPSPSATVVPRLSKAKRNSSFSTSASAFNECHTPHTSQLSDKKTKSTNSSDDHRSMRTKSTMTSVVWPTLHISAQSMENENYAKDPCFDVSPKSVNRSIEFAGDTVSEEYFGVSLHSQLRQSLSQGQEYKPQQRRCSEQRGGTPIKHQESTTSSGCTSGFASNTRLTTMANVAYPVVCFSPTVPIVTDSNGIEKKKENEKTPEEKSITPVDANSASKFKCDNNPKEAIVEQDPSKVLGYVRNGEDNIVPVPKLCLSMGSRDDGFLTENTISGRSTGFPRSSSFPMLQIHKRRTTNATYISSPTFPAPHKHSSPSHTMAMDSDRFDHIDVEKKTPPVAVGSHHSISSPIFSAQLGSLGQHFPSTLTPRVNTHENESLLCPAWIVLPFSDHMDDEGRQGGDGRPVRRPEDSSSWMKKNPTTARGVARPEGTLDDSPIGHTGLVPFTNTPAFASMQASDLGMMAECSFSWDMQGSGNVSGHHHSSVYSSPSSPVMDNKHTDRPLYPDALHSNIGNNSLLFVTSHSGTTDILPVDYRCSTDVEDAGSSSPYSRLRRHHTIAAPPSVPDTEIPSSNDATTSRMRLEGEDDFLFMIPTGQYSRAGSLRGTPLLRSCGSPIQGQGQKDLHEVLLEEHIGGTPPTSASAPLTAPPVLRHVSISHPPPQLAISSVSDGGEHVTSGSVVGSTKRHGKHLVGPRYPSNRSSSPTGNTPFRVKVPPLQGAEAEQHKRSHVHTLSASSNKESLTPVGLRRVPIFSPAIFSSSRSSSPSSLMTVASSSNVQREGRPLDKDQEPIRAASSCFVFGKADPSLESSQILVAPPPSALKTTLLSTPMEENAQSASNGVLIQSNGEQCGNSRETLYATKPINTLPFSDFE